MRVERHSAIEPIAEEWEALADRTGALVFDRPGWLAPWWRAFGAGTLDVIAVRDGGELVAVLPVVRRAGGLHSPTNWHTPEFAPTGTPDGVDAAYDALFGAGPAYVAVRFLDRPRPLQEAAERHGYVAVERVLLRSPYLPLNGDGAGRGEISRKGRDRIRRLGTAGSVELDVRDGGDDLEGVLRLAFELEGSGWKSEQGTAIASRPQTRRFYEEVAGWAAARGALRVFFLVVDGRSVATEYVLAADGSTFNLKGGFDPAYRKYAPGLVLRDLMIDWAREQGYRTHEFLGAPEPWKLEWSRLVRMRYEVIAVRGLVRGSVARVALTRGRPLASRGAHAVRRLGMRRGR